MVSLYSRDVGEHVSRARQLHVPLDHSSQPPALDVRHADVGAAAGVEEADEVQARTRGRDDPAVEVDPALVDRRRALGQEGQVHFVARRAIILSEVSRDPSTNSTSAPCTAAMPGRTLVLSQEIWAMMLG